MAAGKRQGAAKASTSKRASKARAKVNRRTAGTSVEARAKKHPAWLGHSTYAKALRDAVVWERHLSGDAPARIARVDGRSERQIERVIVQWREDQADGPSLLDADPVAILEGMIRRSNMRTSALVGIAMNSTSPTAAVGALKAMREEDAELRMILGETNRFPEMGTFRHVLDLRAIGAKMLDTIEKFRRGEIGPDEVSEVFEEMATFGAGRPALPSGESPAAPE